jgi:hypothetical protein
MGLKKEVRLKTSGHLFIRYPADYKGERSSDSQDDEFYLSDKPRYLTAGELTLAEKEVAKMKQTLVFTGAVLIDPADPLLNYSHDQLDAIERDNSFPCSRKSPAGGTRSIYERVLILRERGYESNAAKFLASSSSST